MQPGQVQSKASAAAAVPLQTRIAHISWLSYVVRMHISCVNANIWIAAAALAVGGAMDGGGGRNWQAVFDLWPSSWATQPAPGFGLGYQRQLSCARTHKKCMYNSINVIRPSTNCSQWRCPDGLKDAGSLENPLHTIKWDLRIPSCAIINDIIQFESKYKREGRVHWACGKFYALSSSYYWLFQ